MELARKIELLDDQIAAAGDGFPSDFSDWRNSAEVLLRTLLGAESEILAKFKKISYTPMFYASGMDTSGYRPAGVKQGMSILRSAKTELMLKDELAAQQPAAQRPARNDPPTALPEPRVFIASSTENLRVANALQRRLEHGHEVTVWSQGVFSAGGFGLEALIRAAESTDFAIFVVDADDVTTSRNEVRNATRDNVIFELGLFIGRLTRERCFMIFDRTAPPDLPSDLAGINPVNYRIHTNGNLDASLGSAASTIAEQIAQIRSMPGRLSPDARPPGPDA